MASTTKKYTITGIIGAIILVLASSTLYISDYRAILIEHPDKLAIISYEDFTNRIELLTKEAPEGIEFTRFLYKDDYMKVYYGTALVATSYWEVFDGSRKLVRGKFDTVRYEQKSDGSFVIIMGIDYYNETSKTNYMGHLTRTIQVYPLRNKETITWTPETSRKYGLHWVVQTKEENNPVDFLKTKTVTSGEQYPIINWEDSFVSITSAKRDAKGKIVLYYKTAIGAQKIDPEIISAKEEISQNVIPTISCTPISKTETIGKNHYRYTIGSALYDTSNGDCMTIEQAINVTNNEEHINVVYKSELITITPSFTTNTGISRLTDIKKTNAQVNHETSIKHAMYGYTFEQNLTSIPKGLSDTITKTGYEINYSGTGKIHVEGNKIIFPNGILIDFNDFANGTSLNYSKGYLMKEGYYDKLDPTITLNTSTTNKDTWISSAALSVDRNYGADVELEVAGVASATPKKALVWINVSSIPAGAIIDNATLTLHKVGGAVSSEVIAYEIFQSWNVGTQSGSACNTAGDTGVTWNNRTCTGNPWNTAGMGEATDYDSFKEANITVASTTDGNFTWNVTHAVNEWVQGSLANNGLVFIGQGSSTTSHRFDSVNALNQNRRPSLVVEYHIPDTSCNPTPGQDWIITSTQRCNGTNINLPANHIYVRAGGQLICNGGTNITSLNGVEARGCSGICMVYGNTGSPQGGCRIITLGG